MTLLGCFAVVAASPARAAAAVQPETPVYDALPAILSTPPFHEARRVHVGLMLTPVDQGLAAVLSIAAFSRRHIVRFYHSGHIPSLTRRLYAARAADVPSDVWFEGFL